MLTAAVLATSMSACDNSDDQADTATQGQRQDDVTKTAKQRQPHGAAAGPDTRGRPHDDDSGSRRRDGPRGVRASHGATKRSDPSSDPATRTALSGDSDEASAAAAAVDGAYKDLAGAVKSGVAAADVAVGNTLEAAEGNDELTRVCRLMSEEAKRQSIDYVRRGAGLADVDWTCKKATGLMLRRTRQHGGLERTLRAEVVGVNAQGDRATATVRFGDERHALSTIPLVKENGQWKLGSSLGGRG